MKEDKKTEFWISVGLSVVFLTVALLVYFDVITIEHVEGGLTTLGIIFFCYLGYQMFNN